VSDWTSCLLDAAAERHVTLQVLPFDQRGHEARDGSLTILTLPDGSEMAYTEDADNGQLIEEPTNVSRYKVIDDRLRAAALPPLMSLDMIRSAMEGGYRCSNVPSRFERRRLAQERLQQSGGGDCVEVADGFRAVVPVRDSKAPQSPALCLDAASWAVFIAELKVGRHRP
jgi:hypothetical protein